ncbi:MAG: hypothetical protein IJ525_00725 [Alphaproteobacteria bacterium]|nr:hypothetical protein [Alphaproteobacteria bacterium]
MNNMQNILEEAWQIAANADVSTPENSVVLYSISYQPTDINKRKALQYMQKNTNMYMLDNTECGKRLIALGLETGNDVAAPEIMKIWALASRRFILSAGGNITAFVENADKRSTFVSVELPLLLQNERVKKINGIDKFEFAKRFGF